MRKSSGRQPRLVRAPVMKDEIAMGMHLAYAVLEAAPNRDSVEMLAQILGMIGIAIEDDSRFGSALLQMHAAVQALDRMDELTRVSQELPYVLPAIVTADAILPRLDVVKLHLANMKLRSMK